MSIRQVSGRFHRPLVHRRFVRQRPIRDLGDDCSALLHAKQSVSRHFSDVHRMQVPLVEDALDLRFAAALHDEQHPLLRLGEHDFVGRHAGLALRDEGDIDFNARPAPRAHLRRGAGEAGRSHVLDPDERVGLHHLEAGLEEQLLHERIADLHRGALLRRLVVELGRGHRRAVNAVAACLRAHVIHGIPDTGRHALDDVRCPGDAQAEHVHQRIAGVGRLEGDLSGDGRHADAVAVAGNPGHDAFQEAWSAARVERPEPQ